MTFQTISYLKLSVAELHRRLEQSTVEHERSMKLISFYLVEMKKRRGYEEFGYENIYDYALDKFGFQPRRTRYFVSVGRRISTLPNLTDSVIRNDVSFSKAAEIARVATPENEKDWIEKTRDKSVREVIDMIQDGTNPRGGNVNIWLSAEQNSILHRALEVCRMSAGENDEQMKAGRCLELICGEFLATYEYEMMKQVEKEAEEAEPPRVVETDLENEGSRAPESEENPEPEESTSTASEAAKKEEDPAEAQRHDSRMCPEDDVLPAPVPASYTKTHLEILKRDSYRCQVPGCSVRRGLQVHHIRYRSRFGKKNRTKMNEMSNLLVTCTFHHRQIHAGLFGLEGQAPDKLKWRWPVLEETATERLEKAGAFEGYDPDDFETEETATEPGDGSTWFDSADSGDLAAPAM